MQVSGQVADFQVGLQEEFFGFYGMHHPLPEDRFVDLRFSSRLLNLLLCLLSGHVEEGEPALERMTSDEQEQQ